MCRNGCFNCLEIEGRTCDVKGFHDSYGSIKNINYVNVVYKYNDSNAQEYLFELNQALDFTKSMKNSILCTNQARHHGVIVNDVPRVIDKTSPQCMSFPNQNINLPLLMKGPVPVLPVSKPNAEDLVLLPKLQLTSDDQPWVPQDIFGNEIEEAQPYYPIKDEYYISGLMELQGMVYHHNINSIRNSSRDGKCSAGHLSRLWGIDIKAAERTVTATTSCPSET